MQSTWQKFFDNPSVRAHYAAQQQQLPGQEVPVQGHGGLSSMLKQRRAKQVGPPAPRTASAPGR